MPHTSYVNFDLLIIGHDEEYQARVIDSPVGQAATTFGLPFHKEELQSFFWFGGRSLRAWHLADSHTEAQLDPQSFGERLYDAVFANAVGELLVRSYDSADANGKGLRIRLRLDPGSQELADLPWEYLYVSDWQRFLALSDQTPVVRYVEIAAPERPLLAGLPLRILAVVSSPRDAVPLDVEKEWTRLQNALADLQEHQLIVLERLVTATPDALQDRLRQTEVHILHFIGHGAFDPNTSEGVLIFEDEDGDTQQVSAKTLATLVHDHDALRMVFLNACEGARSDNHDSFSGVAQRLVQQGIPAVLAMQFEVSDSAAITLAHEFYQALADYYPVDTAVSEVRKALYVAGNALEWGTPVLYMRAPDGYIFVKKSADDLGPSRPAWNTRGAICLAAGLAGIVLLIGVGYYLLSDRSMLRATLGTMGALVVLVLSFLGLREDRTLFPRISQWIGRSYPVQAGTVLLLVLGIALWGTVGWSKTRCGPLPCPPHGVRNFAIGEWQNLTPGTSAFEDTWTKGTPAILYDKLSSIGVLRGVALDSPQTAADISQYLDLWITGRSQKLGEVQLSADLAGRGGVFDGSVTVRGAVDEQSERSGSQILALQNRLAEEILAKLGIELSPEMIDQVHKMPTSNGRALNLNNEGAEIVDQGLDLQGAESKFREAIQLDPIYASPHNNLGRVFYMRDDLNNALVEHQRAVELAPDNPIFFFNLGLTLERMGAYAAAVDAYARAVELDPAYVKALNNLGYTYLLMGELGKAHAVLQDGLDLAPNEPFLHKNLGRVYLEQGEASRAAEELRRAVDLFTDGVYVEALYPLALAYQAMDRTGDACTALHEYTEAAPPDSPDWSDAQALVSTLQCP